MLGLGNTSDDPTTFGIGLLTTPVVQVGAPMFDLYEWAHLEPDLWAACRNAAAINRRLGIPDAIAVDADLLLSALIDNIHAACLASGAGYVDRSLAEEPA